MVWRVGFKELVGSNPLKNNYSWLMSEKGRCLMESSCFNLAVG